MKILRIRLVVPARLRDGVLPFTHRTAREIAASIRSGDVRRGRIRVDVCAGGESGAVLAARVGASVGREGRRS